MTFLRDEMYWGDLASWRYGSDTDYVDWRFNMGNTADEISIALFGA